MRALFILVVWLYLAATPALAQHFGATPPAKPSIQANHPQAPATRVGGDTIADAVPILELPFSDTGSTVFFSDDYNEDCPDDAAGSPDVVYSLELIEEVVLTVDLCGSDYDTKVYIYDEAQQLIVCNDDFYFHEPCGAFVSKIAYATIPGGQTVYIIVDGWGGWSGDYVIEITSGPEAPCFLPCPPLFVPEGEPPLVDGYVDNWNGGCNTDEFNPAFQVLNDPLPPDTGLLCGVSGWYTTNGFTYRDTDWFEVYIDGDGEVNLTLDAQQRMLLLELFPQDCIIAAADQSVASGPCEPVTMTVTGPPQSWVWIWAGPVSYTPPEGFEGNEFEYLLWTDDTPTVAPGSATPPAARLLPVHPNPFNPQTTVRFELTRSQHVVVAVYDPSGRRLAVLVDEVRGAGAHAVDWNGRDRNGRELPSGGYMVRLEAESGDQVRKATLVR